MTEPPAIPNDGNKPSKPAWFRRLWVHIVLLIILPYIQVPAMWILKAFSLRTRIILTVIGCWWALMRIFPEPFVYITVYPISRAAYLISHPGGNTTNQGEDTVGTGPPVQIAGNVISVVDDGVLVDRYGYKDIVFLKGRFDKVDGDQVVLKAISIGTYKYTSAMGSARTVRAFRAVGK